jgi:hypothetical protein
MKRLLPLALILLSGCFTSSEDALRTLDNAGFTDAQITGTSYLGCDKYDRYGAEFTATNAHEKRVTGIVCCGLFFKGCTIRF